MRRRTCRRCGYEGHDVSDAEVILDGFVDRISLGAFVAHTILFKPREVTLRTFERAREVPSLRPGERPVRVRLLLEHLSKRAGTRRRTR